jgi:hypothetical protein
MAGRNALKGHVINWVNGSMGNTKKDRPPCDNNNTKRNLESFFRRILIHSLEKTNVFLYNWALVKIPTLTA